jgi:hypothetical protein
MVAIAVVGAAPAYADINHNDNNCQAIEAGGGSYPGNAGTSPGSVFNEPPTSSTSGPFTGNSLSGGTGGQAYNNAGAPSQYDTGCAKVTANGTGTPMQTSTPVPTQVPNNSIATRTANGVTSHQGKR